MHFFDKQVEKSKNGKTTKYKVADFTVFQKEKFQNNKKLKVFNITVLKKILINGGRYKQYSTICNLPLYKQKIKNHDFDEKKGLIFFNATDIPEKFEFPEYENPLVSIIIPAFNQYNNTKKCLWSVLKCTKNIPFEVIIADNNSDDETKKLEQNIKNIKISRNNGNTCFAENCNKAAKLAKGEYLYFLNSNTIVQPDCLKELLNTFKYMNNTGIAGSKVYDSNGKLLSFGGYIFAEGLYKAVEKPNDSEEAASCDTLNKHYKSMYKYIKPADYVLSSLLTQKTLFEALNGFDTRYVQADYAVTDYCLSVQAKGCQTFVQPNSKIIISQADCQTEAEGEDNKALKDKHKGFFASRVEYDIRKIPYSGKTRPASILIVDDKLPEFDRSAGGKTMLQFVELFLNKGFNVKFCPLSEKNRKEKYYSLLTNMGVEIIEKKNFEDYLKYYGCYTDYILISRPTVAENIMIKSLKARGIKVLYYGHDLHHLRMQRELETSENPIYTQKQIEDMQFLEKLIIEFADWSYYPSKVEEEYIKKNCRLNNVSVITPYMYKTEEMPQHLSFEESKDLIFVGSMHAPNKTGLIWFLDNIFNKVIEQIPDIKLNVVGNIGKNDIKKNKNINILGSITDKALTELYLKTKISIVPLLYGAGIKGKVINSLYYSTPVVTTSIGAEGIDISYGNIYIADNEADFAKKIIDLYTNKNHWEASLKGYKDIISKEYSFDKAWNELKKQIDPSFRSNEERLVV